MSSPFVAEIRMFAGNFAPTGWASCDGQLLPISQNTALFSPLGTFYGGDGKSTFALPDLQGSVAMGQGQGPGLSERFLGETGGVANVSLILSEMPFHNHLIAGTTENGTLKQPSPTEFLARSKSGNLYQSNVSSSPVSMDPQTFSVAGSSFPHNNMQPFLTLTYIIALQGVL